MVYRQYCVLPVPKHIYQKLSMQKPYPIYDRLKSIPFGAAHTYIAIQGSTPSGFCARFLIKAKMFFVVTN